MNIEPLFDAIISAVAFFALSNEQIVESDAAIKQLEAIASHLQNLHDEVREHFISYTHELSIKGAGGNNPEYLTFLADLAENLGLR